MKQSTLIFLVRQNEILLAMKKRGFGANRWNGVGGKVESGESIEEAARRECKEEIDVVPGELKEVAVIDFIFPSKPDWNQTVTAYFSETWDGNPSESEEMSPKWFSFEDLPFNEMWSDDKFWLPEVLKGKNITATFTLGDNDEIISYIITDKAAATS